MRGRDTGRVSRIGRIIPSGSEGHSLVEVVVALALLLTALVPTGLLVTHVAERRTGVEMTQAILLAHSEMEASLERESPRSMARTEKRWRIVTEVADSSGLRTHHVEVMRSRGGRPLASLVTLRWTGFANNGHASD